MSNNKKLIEVSIPLDAINKASVHEKYIRVGHPSVIHKWWSRKPLVTARGVIFSSLVDDPGEYLRDNEKIQKERSKLFSIVEELVDWDNTANEAVLEKARKEIARSIARELDRELPEGKEEILAFLTENAPPLWDPFTGGGSIPLEAARLGLRTYGSDLNPIAVLINKATLEIPQRFFDHSRISKDENSKLIESKYKGLEGFAEDIRFYGKWVLEKAKQRVGNYYPEVPLPGYESKKATIVAWLWARTVKCPNPACKAETPLVSKWRISKDKESVTWVQPQVDHTSSPADISYSIKTGEGPPPERTVSRSGAKCIACETPIELKYIRQEGKRGNLGKDMIAVALKGEKGRVYLPPSKMQIELAEKAEPVWKPEQEIQRGMVGNIRSYGINTFGDMFTDRQLLALNTIANLITEVHKKIIDDGKKVGLPEDDRPFYAGGKGPRAYADAIKTYLAFAFSNTLNRCNAFVPWGVSVECPVNLFSRHTLPFIWDFAETNVISGPSGSFESMLEGTVRGFENLGFRIQIDGSAFLGDAVEAGSELDQPVISTDPPYYDVIPYSDLSDFFYVWLRKLLKDTYPDIFDTLRTPKEKELIADKYRSGSKEKAKAHFENEIRKAFGHFREVANNDFPITIYYAYKQKKRSKKGEDRSGWETILSGIVNSGFSITGTWPLRTERETKMSSIGSNVLSSSIVLVCRKREENAPVISRREFVSRLREELPESLKQMQSGNIAPVDLAQASIGPGMSVFSRYNKVLESDGSRMSIRTALQLINQELDSYLEEQDSSLDHDSRFAVDWFEEYGFDNGPFGQADILARAKNTSVEGLEKAGILNASRGDVSLYHWSELKSNWDPKKDKRLPVWEATHQMIRRLNNGGEERLAQLMANLTSTMLAEAQHLTYRLFNICEQKGWAKHALDYNSLIVSWDESQEQAQVYKDQYKQSELF